MTRRMTKNEVIKLFGGSRRSIRETARQLEIARGTIHAWPERGPIPRTAQDRVLSVMTRRRMEIPAKWMQTNG